MAAAENTIPNIFLHLQISIYYQPIFETCKFSLSEIINLARATIKGKKLKSDEFIEERLRAISIMLIYFIASPFRCHFAVEIGRALSRVANSNIDDPFKAFNRSRIDSKPNCD